MVIIDNSRGQNSSGSTSATIANSEIKIMGSDLTTTSGTVDTTITDLTFAVAANTRYRLLWELRIGCDNTGGVRFTPGGPSGSTISGYWFAGNNSATAQIQAHVNSYTIFAAVNTGNYLQNFMKITAIVQTGANAGNITLSFRSTTAGQTSSVYANSYLYVDQLI